MMTSDEISYHLRAARQQLAMIEMEAKMSDQSKVRERIAQAISSLQALGFAILARGGNA